MIFFFKLKRKNVEINLDFSILIKLKIDISQPWLKYYFLLHIFCCRVFLF